VNKSRTAIDAWVNEHAVSRFPISPPPRYPDDSIKSQLAKYGSPLVLLTAPAKADALAEPVGVGHMYDLVVPVHLPSQADAIFFIPRVTLLRA